MKYELMNELKDAGFPQGTDRVIPKGSGKLDAQGNLHLPYVPVYSPSLSELIHACGEDFGSLEKMDTYWLCSHFTGDKYEVPPRYTGDTLEEAVAHLWLALNK